MLTAEHVWDALDGDTFAVATDNAHGIVEISKRWVKLVSSGCHSTDEWGPDLAAIQFPDAVARSVLPNTKSWRNLDVERSRFGDPPFIGSSLYVLAGVPAELSTFELAEHTLGVTVIAFGKIESHAKNGVDYIDLAFDRSQNSAAPQDYGGMSGSGLWAIEFERNQDRLEWTTELSLQGIAFFQANTDADRGIIRCHGRRGIDTLLRSTG